MGFFYWGEDPRGAREQLADYLENDTPKSRRQYEVMKRAASAQSRAKTKNMSAKDKREYDRVLKQWGKASAKYHKSQGRKLKNEKQDRGGGWWW
jgi:hypothetical protein